MTDRYTLYSAPGGGGMIVHAAFALEHIPIKLERVSWDDLGWQSKVIGHLNPLGQVPTMILPSGEVMTESAAMLLLLKDIAPESTLIPDSTDPSRPAFLRWLMVVNAALYPTFAYSDVPERWVQGDEQAAGQLKTGVDDHRKTLLTVLEQQAVGPWFLGAQMTALDLYFMTLRFWDPGLEWCASHVPTLDRIGHDIAEIEPVRQVLDQYFDPS